MIRGACCRLLASSAILHTEACLKRADEALGAYWSHLWREQARGANREVLDGIRLCILEAQANVRVLQERLEREEEDDDGAEMVNGVSGEDNDSEWSDESSEDDMEDSEGE